MKFVFNRKGCEVFRKERKEIMLLTTEVAEFYTEEHREGFYRKIAHRFSVLRLRTNLTTKAPRHEDH